MNLEKILEEIYALDESLRAHDKELRKVLQDMLKAKPNVKLSADFEKKLRRELLAYAEQLQSKKNIFNFYPMKNFAYALGGLAVLALLITPFVYKFQTERHFLSDANPLSNTIKISESAEDFDIDFDQAQNGSTSVAVVDAKMGMGGARAEMSSIMPYPSYDQSYSYVYTGEDFKLDDEKLAVLKVEREGQKVAMTNMLSELGFEMVDLSKFENLEVGNINLRENRANGYAIYVDLQYGTISISRDWERWENKDQNCTLDDKQIKEDEIIRLADDFLKKYNVNLENYGKPQLREDMAIILKSDYTPTSYGVIYPLMIEGQKVVSSWGDVVGINVDVDLCSKSVSGANNISLQSYTSKKYDAVKDFGVVKKYLESMSSKFSFEEEQDNEKAKLSTPERVWMQYSSYNGKENKEYLVPALSFKVEYPEGKDYYQKQITVPLVKDMFEKMQSQK